MHNGNTTTSSWLLDTGATASFIAQDIALQHGVRYRSGHELGSDDPLLEYVSDGSLVPNQYQIPIGGISSALNVAGFHLDKLSVPTMEGDPIEYLSAPVLVLDVSLEDPDTQETFTLDGVFGMNFLVASTEIQGGLFGDIRVGAFDFITFDEPSGVVSLVFNPDILPEPSGLLLMAVATTMILVGWVRNRSPYRRSRHSP